MTIRHWWSRFIDKSHVYVVSWGEYSDYVILGTYNHKLAAARHVLSEYRMRWNDWEETARIETYCRIGDSCNCSNTDRLKGSVVLYIKELDFKDILESCRLVP